jgi:hypothetical protein
VLVLPQHGILSTMLINRIVQLENCFGGGGGGKGPVKGQGVMYFPFNKTKKAIYFTINHLKLHNRLKDTKKKV